MIFVLNFDFVTCEDELIEEMKNSLSALDYKIDKNREDVYYIKVKSSELLPSLVKGHVEDIWSVLLDCYSSEYIKLNEYLPISQSIEITLEKMVSVFQEDNNLDLIAEKLYDNDEITSEDDEVYFKLMNLCFKSYMKKLYIELTEAIKNNDIEDPEWY